MLMMARSSMRPIHAFDTGRPSTRVARALTSCSTSCLPCATLPRRLAQPRYVPDSNKLPYPTFEGEDEWYAQSVPAVMPKGSVLFFEGQCFHAAGDNTSSERRYAVTVDYCAGYLRTQENFLFSTPADRVRTFSDDLQQLLGLRMCGGLGHVYNHNPMT